MDFLKTMILRFVKEIIIGIEAIAIVVIAILLQKKDVKVEYQSEDITPLVEEAVAIEEAKTIKVDVKGAVAKPGVYEIVDTSNVNDVIALAGGLKKNADTSNINLSRRVSDQMVIKVFTSSEIKKINATTSNTESCITNTVVIDSCKESSMVEVGQGGESDSITTDDNSTQNTQTTPSIISINTATLEELMTLSDIGESKAKKIIEYRQTVGKFTKIEDIMNVSGIGEATFNKIKDYITI